MEEKIKELLAAHPEAKEAFDKLVELKGKLNKEDIEAFLKEHSIDLPDNLDELKEQAEKLFGEGKEGLGKLVEEGKEGVEKVLNDDRVEGAVDAIKEGLGKLFKKD